MLKKVHLLSLDFLCFFTSMLRYSRHFSTIRSTSSHILESPLNVNLVSLLAISLSTLTLNKSIITPAAAVAFSSFPTFLVCSRLPTHPAKTQFQPSVSLL